MPNCPLIQKPINIDTSACAKLPVVVQVMPGVRNSSASSWSTWSSSWSSSWPSPSSSSCWADLYNSFKLSDGVAQHHVRPTHLLHCQLPVGLRRNFHHHQLFTLVQSYCRATLRWESCLHNPNCSSTPRFNCWILPQFVAFINLDLWINVAFVPILLYRTLSYLFESLAKFGFRVGASQKLLTSAMHRIPRSVFVSFIININNYAV